MVRGNVGVLACYLSLRATQPSMDGKVEYYALSRLSHGGASGERCLDGQEYRLLGMCENKQVCNISLLKHSTPTMLIRVRL